MSRIIVTQRVEIGESFDIDLTVSVPIIKVTPVERELVSAVTGSEFIPPDTGAMALALADVVHAAVEAMLRKRDEQRPE
jgi:hypothetical protein